MGEIRDGGGSAGIESGTIGEIGGITVPAGYLECNGQAVSRTTYAGLFAKIGTSYGAGDGSTTFNLPDLPIKLGQVRTCSTVFPINLANAAACALPDGRILVVGGENGAAVSSTATYFGTLSNGNITWAAGTVLPAARTLPAIVALADGRVLITGGYDGAAVNNTTYFGTISGNTITWASGTNMSAARCGHRLHQLDDGRILLMGGRSSRTPSGAVSNTYFGTISGNTITWEAGTAMATAVCDVGSFVKGNYVFYAGGYNTSGASQTLVYSGLIATNTITWTRQPNLLHSHVTNMWAQIGSSCLILGGGSDTVVGNSSIIFQGQIQQSGLAIHPAGTMNITKNLSFCTPITGQDFIVVGAGYTSNYETSVSLVSFSRSYIKA